MQLLGTDFMQLLGADFMQLLQDVPYDVSDDALNLHNDLGVGWRFLRIIAILNVFIRINYGSSTYQRCTFSCFNENSEKL